MTNKQMAPMEWVKLAASTDRARPVLCAVRVTPDYAEATDGHRLHRAPVDGFADGLFDVKTGARTEGRFPSTDQVIPRTPPTHTVNDPGEFAAVVAAAVAYGKVSDRPGLVTFSTATGTVAVNARFVADAIRILGARDSEFSISATGPLHPVRLDFANGALALLMPTRVDSGRPSLRFDVSECMVLAGYGAGIAEVAA